MKLAITKTVDQLRDALADAVIDGRQIVFVPTMGALHAGHISLVNQAKEIPNACVVVSIFVNPSQFAPNEDFSKYPRTLEADFAMLEEAAVDVLFLPEVNTIYPVGFSTKISVPALAKYWDGEFRPTHFEGVATVVARLFGLVKPDAAIFGEKDFQQLAIIKRMVDDLALGIQIIGAPVIREADGLAMSSRNRYLSADDRAIALKLYEVMIQLRDELLNNKAPNVAIEIYLHKAKQHLLNKGFTQIDYLALVDAETLEPVNEITHKTRILAAVWLGSTRLIDNIAIESDMVHE